MTQFHIFHVIRNGSFFFGDFHDLIVGNEQKFGVLVYKLFDEPGASHTVYLDMFTGDPLHETVLLLFYPKRCKRNTTGMTRERVRQVSAQNLCWFTSKLCIE